MEPIKYDIASPFAQAAEGIKFGAGIYELEQKRIAAENQRIAQQQYQQLTAKLLSPNATASDFEAAMLFGNKDQADVIKNMMASRDDRQNKALLGQISPIAFAFKTGNTQEGIDSLSALAQANENSGDAEEAQYLRSLIDIAKTDPTKVGNLFAGKMTMIPGGKDALESLLKLSQEGRVSQAHAKATEIMSGVTTMEQLQEKMPSLAALGPEGLEILHKLETGFRLREGMEETRAARQAQRAQEKIETLRTMTAMNALFGLPEGQQAFVVKGDELEPNESVWSKFAFVPTAGGPDMAVPGGKPLPAPPQIDTTKAMRLGLDESTIELIRAQISLDPKAGARLLADIVKSSIRQKISAQKPETLSAHAKMLEESGVIRGTPEFQRAMAEHVKATTRGAATGGAPVIQVGMGEAMKAKGREFGQFAVDATKAAEAAADVGSDVGLVVEGLRGMGGGPVGQFKAWAGQFLPEETGWGKIASMSELANTIQAKLAPNMRAAGSGSTSDMEMKMFLRAVPTIATTEPGRELMLKYANRIANRTQIRAEVVNEIEAAGRLPSPEEIRRKMRDRVGDRFFDEADKAYFGLKAAPGGAKPETVTVGGKTYSRPANFTDAQWNAYKQAVGAK